jgi:hypothetical protein
VLERPQVLERRCRAVEYGPGEPIFLTAIRSPYPLP